MFGEHFFVNFLMERGHVFKSKIDDGKIIIAVT
jgi:hypothetical protein